MLITVISVGTERDPATEARMSEVAELWKSILEHTPSTALIPHDVSIAQFDLQPNQTLLIQSKYPLESASFKALEDSVIQLDGVNNTALITAHQLRLQIVNLG